MGTSEIRGKEFKKWRLNDQPDDCSTFIPFRLKLVMLDNNRSLKYQKSASRLWGCEYVFRIKSIFGLSFCTRYDEFKYATKRAETQEKIQLRQNPVCEKILKGGDP